MLYISEFFVNKKEAVSNQIELLRSSTSSSLFAAAIFMDQAKLNRQDLKAKRFIFPLKAYLFLLPFVAIFSKHSIHYFEEEPNTRRQLIFNLARKPLYISMYRKPFKEYVDHVKKYKYLKKIFVELELHKKILIEHDFPEQKIEVIHTPSLFRAISFDDSKEMPGQNLIFASWNGGTIEKLEERGLLYALQILKENPKAELVIPLRDNQTKIYLAEAAEIGVEQRLHLVLVKDYEHLTQLYKDCDYVIFLPKKKVTKDVPNSVLDGFMHLKPCVISHVIDFAEVVSRNDLGIVIKDFSEVFNLTKISPLDYKRMQHKILNYRELHSPEKYKEIINHYENINY